MIKYCIRRMKRVRRFSMLYRLLLVFFIGWSMMAVFFLSFKMSSEPKTKQITPPLLLPKALYGEMGQPVILPSNISKDLQKIIDEGWEKNVFNQYISDLISVHRSLPDFRDAWCKAQNYTQDLPQTSVIICFHNEAWSTLLRTVHSVIKYSPSHLIKEIILVDDSSYMPHLKRQLDEYMAMYPIVKIVRATKREGLIRARLLGMKHATAPVLTYLDAHCECTKGWLEPLLDRIYRDETTVVWPHIGRINFETLEYQHSHVNITDIGGFWWDLLFHWIQVPKREKKRRQNPAEPIRSPIMIGGLFSISAAFFDKLGTYDNEFDIWGGENLELSFKTWMCGGTIEVIPCSNVGHLHRIRTPYKWQQRSLVKNLVRLSQVWLDEFAHNYYLRIGYNLGDFGDVEPRRQLRRKLGCKSFKWYLDNIYPELYNPGDSVANGRIIHEDYRLCIESRCDDLNKPIRLRPCNKNKTTYNDQYWFLTKNGEIRRDNACFDYSGKDVVLYDCHGLKGHQHWSYNPDTNLIKHMHFEKCIGISSNKQNVTMENCNVELSHLRWKFDNYNATRAKDAGLW